MFGLGIANMCAKFDHSSLSGDMVGVHQNLNGLRDLTTLLQGWLAIHGLALVTINLSTKFEVSISTHHEDNEMPRTNFSLPVGVWRFWSG